MSKHNFTEEEVKNLSRLLLNEEETNIQLGMQLIKKELGVLVELEKEILLIAELNTNENLRTAANKLLNAFFDKTTLAQKKEKLELFKHSWGQINWTYRKKILKKYIAAHQEYEACLFQNKLYVRRLEDVLYQMVDSYIWVDNDFMVTSALPADILASLKLAIETITPTLLKINKNHALALECLMFVHAVPEYRSAQALKYYEQHSDLKYWSKWLYQHLGEVQLFECKELEKAIVFFEKANADKDFEGLDLFIAKLANDIYLNRANKQQEDLADALLQRFLAKYKESIHAHLLWANRLCQNQKSKVTIQQEYFTILDRLPNGLMLTGSIGWVGLRHIDKRFKNEFDVDAFIEHTELLIEELPHPKQLEQALATIVELLEWDNHPSYQDELLVLLSKVAQLQA